MEHPRVLCCTHCALLEWKLPPPRCHVPPPPEGAIVGYVTEWDVAYRRNIIVRVVQRRAFSEPPSHRARCLRSPPSPLVECRAEGPEKLLQIEQAVCRGRGLHQPANSPVQGVRAV